MYRWKILVCLFIIAVPFLLITCSDSGTGDDEDNVDSVQTSVGPDGGTVIINRKINLNIPAGALDDTVDFTIEVNNSPTPIGGTMAFVSPVYSVEPTGTMFNIPASIAIFYESDQLYGHDSTDIVLYTNDGTGWTALSTIIDNAEPAAWAMISHLSDFALAVDTSGGSVETGELFCILVAARNIVNVEGTTIKMDLLTAKFDSSYAPCDPIDPQQAGGVVCNDKTLTWMSETNTYLYQNVFDMSFITLGEKMKFTVTGNASVPSFADSINFPDAEVVLTSPTSQAVVTHSGFMVNWNGSDVGGSVRIVLVSASADSVLSVETANDGSHEITSSDLEGKANGEYGLLLIYEDTDYIDADGIDPRSIIAARIFNSITVNLAD